MAPRIFFDNERKEIEYLLKMGMFLFKDERVLLHVVIGLGQRY